MATPAQLVGQSDLDLAGLTRYVRVELGLTQREFGRLLGVRAETISLWENDHKKPPFYKDQLIQAAAIAIERGGVPFLAARLEACGPAFALWRVLDAAYGADDV